MKKKKEKNQQTAHQQTASIAQPFGRGSGLLIQSE